MPYPLYSTIEFVCIRIWKSGKPSQKLRDVGALKMSTKVVTKVKDLANIA